MNAFTFVFLVALTLATGLRWWLSARQLRHVAAHRQAVPESFEDRITLDVHQRAADYTSAKTRLAMVDNAVTALLLLAWTLGGGVELLDAAWRSVAWPPIVVGTCFIVSALLILGLLDVPFDLYRTFVIEERFGFNRTTLGVYVADALKHAALLVVIGGPLVALVLWLMGHAGPLWWVYVWCVWMAFIALMIWAYPAFIAPLFNKFMPLQDSELVQRIEALLHRNGFAAKGVFVMDGSRRSGHGNAYFTGLGTNKRIVFFDTLLEHLNADEIEAVLAHELGHFKRRHVAKQIALNAVVSLAALALLGWLIDAPWFYAGLGVEHPSLPVALFLFLLVAPVFTVFLQPSVAWLSRRHEFEADEFAARQASAEMLIQALVKLYRENASTLTPDPLYSAFHDSHPPAVIRVAHLQAKA